MTSRSRIPAVLVLICCAAVLTGCGGADTDVSPGVPVTGQTSVAADDCGGVAITVQEHLNSSNVRTVSVNGQCTNVVVDTELDDEDDAGGRRLCEAAGEVAYTGDTDSVTVRSKSGTELSVGVPGMKCLP